MLVGFAAVVALAGAGRADAQTSPASHFNISISGTSVGSEDVSVERGPDGWTITSSGRITAPSELVLRQFTARYDTGWRPLELTLEATVRGTLSTLHTTVTGTSASTELSSAVPGEPILRTDTVDGQAILLPNPFIAPFEAVAARLQTADAGSTLFLYQPGQGSFTAIVGASAPERIQTVERVINAKRTEVTFQAASQPPTEVEVWADERGRLLRLRIPSQALEVSREDMTAVSTRRVAMTRANDEDIRIQANGFSLAGTLSRPEGKQTPLPAVVLVSGSGPTDRDETVAGIAVFGQLAHALADAGFLVVRYDKRGVGQSGGRTESATLGDYAEDVRAAVRMLSERKDVDKRRIALVGHSEGGSLAMIAASKDKRVAAIALVSTIGGTGADLNMYQVTHALERTSRPDAERQSTLDLQRRIQQAVLTGKGWDTISIPDAIRRQADTPYFQSFLAFDPASVMKNIDQPLLIVQGTLDTQVPPNNADTLEALAKARKGSRGVEVVKVPGVNHLLVPATTGEVDEYARLGNAQVSPAVIAALEAWLRKTLTR